jgi:membrane protein YqaA with SNARE-associated domain
MQPVVVAVASALVVGVVAALVPVVTAEVYLAAVVSVVTGPVGLACAFALAVGQTAGKCVLFAAARRGRRWAAERDRPRRVPRRPEGRVTRARARLTAWSTGTAELLDRPWPAAGVLLASASVGLPPLAATSVAAGMRRTRLALFAGCTLAGRTVRFGAVAFGGLAVAGTAPLGG